MKQKFAERIVLDMLPYLNNAQIMQLQKVLGKALQNVQLSRESDSNEEKYSNNRLTDLFLSAKRVEGCSEKSLKYYGKTICTMLEQVKKPIQEIETDDLRNYLTSYQIQKNSSRVTIDNIRRILSSFFSWLEDEDYILKSPVRRIHKVKSASTVKETYTDEALEKLRDNCEI